MINEIVYHERRKCIYTLPSFYKRELYIRVKHNDKQSHLSFVEGEQKLSTQTVLSLEAISSARVLQSVKVSCL